MPDADSGGLQLPRLQARGLREEAYAVLRAAILAKEIPMGERVREAEVAERLGVSRAPVREAFRQLQQEGLIKFYPNRGAVVVGVPEEEIDIIYQLRSLIEEQAVARIAETVSDANIEQLQAIIDEMQVAADAKDMATVARLDLEFHGHLVGLAGFVYLRHLWESLDGLVRLRSYQAFDHPGKLGRHFRSGAASTHLPIIAALRSRDPELASRAIREHIMEVPHLLSTPAPSSKASRANAQR